jgi:thioredoxin 1
MHTTRRLALLIATSLFLAAPSWALDIQPYSAATLSKAQAEGKPVVLHFHADWCPTCRAQQKSLDALKAEPKLELTVLTVNYDTEGELKKQLKVRGQSTFIAFKGKDERARLIGGTSVDDVRGLLKAAL